MPDTPHPSKFYLTTPIYYVNARPHIGHAYTTLVADVLARRHRLLGPEENKNTYFLTGTDEHGQKIERSAAAAGIPPQQFADQVSASFESLWKRLGITNNDFIRTTDPRHQTGAQKLFRTLWDRGQIYLSSYTGQYCVSEEMFVEGPPGTIGPDGRPTETVTEENFFFRLSDFQLPLLDLIESNTLQITPDSRRNEVLSFLRGNTTATDPGAPGLASETWEAAPPNPAIAHTAAGTPYLPGALKDLSISRSSFTWGIPVPEDIQAAAQVKEPHVIYVWLDALANYMTAIGYGSDTPEDQALFDKYWPADLHLVGKEIIRFHCVYWPAFLLALNPALALPEKNLPAATPGPKLTPEEHREWAAKWLPKAITAHGWLLFDNAKMSKSKGNIVRTETILDAFGEVYRKGIADYNQAQLKKDPAFHPIPEPTKPDQDLFATDVLRYFLLREIPFGQDGSFSFEAMITRYNADLTNGYGNLVSRVFALLSQNCEASIPPAERQRLVIGQIEPRNIDAPDGRTRFSPGTDEVVQRGTIIGSQVADELFKSGLPDLQTRLQFVSLVDEYISHAKPWKFAKETDPVSRQALREVLYTAADSIRILTALLYPILPYTTAKVWTQLGLGDIKQAAANGELNNLTWGGLPPGTKLGPLSPIFPRADKGLAQTMADTEANAAALLPTNTPAQPGLPIINNSVDAATAEPSDFPQTPLADAVSPTPLSPQATDGPYPNETPNPSRLSGETNQSTAPDPPSSTAPNAGPRSLDEPNPIAQVAGAATPHPDLPQTPPHTQSPPRNPSPPKPPPNPSPPPPPTHPPKSPSTTSPKSSSASPRSSSPNASPKPTSSFALKSTSAPISAAVRSSPASPSGTPPKTSSAAASSSSPISLPARCAAWNRTACCSPPPPAKTANPSSPP